MKVAITGHKHGLGEALYNKLTIYNRFAKNDVIGFDIEDGYDIGNKLALGKILYSTKDVDIFINNAYHPTGQTDLLQYLIKSWSYKNKIIIHIGTFLVKHEITDNMLDIHKTYIRAKKNQKSLIEEHQKIDPILKIIQINPGFMDTNFLKIMESLDQSNLLNVLDCADAIVYTIKMLDKGIYIKELTLDNL